MERDLTLSLRNALTFPSSLKMTAVMPGEWAAEAVASVEVVASTITEEVTKDAEAVAAMEAAEVAVATTTTPAEATVAVAIKPEVNAVEAEETVVVVVTTIAATEAAVTTEATKEAATLVASTTAHLDGVDLKHLLRETSNPTITTMIKACPAATEDLEVLLSSLVEVETEVAASPTVEEVEEMEATVADMAVRLLNPVARTLLRVTPTTLPLPTMAVASREEELPADLLLLEDRAASTNRSLPILTRNPKPAVENPAPFTSETSTRTPLTLLSPSSLANRTLRSR